MNKPLAKLWILVHIYTTLNCDNQKHWNEWEQWGMCSLSCKTNKQDGIRIRTRKCEVKGACGP